MKKNFFKFLVVAAVFACSCSSLFAQQITKFAVVDTSKVYQAYFRNSAPVRNYDSKKAEFQSEINKMVTELQTLHDKQVEAKRSGNDALAMKLQAQITQKSEYLTEYTNAKNVELETLKNSLKSNDAFYKKLYDTLERIAESGGYSMILSLQQSKEILWYSSSVDITDQVIAQLGL